MPYPHTAIVVQGWDRGCFGPSQFYSNPRKNIRNFGLSQSPQGSIADVLYVPKLTRLNQRGRMIDEAMRAASGRRLIGQGGPV
jgi:hypothetical protein